MLLNSLSTAAMVKLGRTYSNLMIGMNGRNAKLRQRQITILMEASGESEPECRAQLAKCGGDLRRALLCLLSALTPEQAALALEAESGSIRAALAAVNTRPSP
jgi:N-acetylmuramic acid 6-phosphate etherase